MGFEQGRRTCFFTTVDPMNIPMLPPRVDESNRDASLRIQTGKIAQQSSVVRSKARAGHGEWYVWQTISNAIILYEPALMSHFEGFEDQIANWTCEDGKDCLMYGRDKSRLEYCLEQDGRIR